MRRKKLTARQRSSLRYKQRAPIGIGETRDQKKAREDALEARVIRQVHGEIWRTRPAWCQLCHGRRVGECRGMPDQMHEHPSRAKTRGLPPEQRFNLVTCGRVCVACHEDCTANKIEPIFADPALGWSGPVSARRRR